VGALERCHFEWLREAGRRAEVHDPLLPAVPAPEADAALSQELVCAGADDQEAARFAVELRRGAMESEAVELRSAAPKVAGEPPQDRHPGRARQLDVSIGSCLEQSVRSRSRKRAGWGERVPVARTPLSTISDEQFAKLRAMLAQASSAATSAPS